MNGKEQVRIEPAGDLLHLLSRQYFKQTGWQPLVVEKLGKRCIKVWTLAGNYARQMAPCRRRCYLLLKS